MDEQDGVSIDSVLAQYQMELVQAKHAEIMAKAEAQMLRERLAKITEETPEKVGSAEVVGEMSPAMDEDFAATMAADTRKEDAERLRSTKR